MWYITLEGGGEVRDLQLVFSCASARISHLALRRAVPPPLQTHTHMHRQVSSDTHVKCLQVFFLV